MRQQLTDFIKIKESIERSFKLLLHSPIRCLMLFITLLTLGFIVYFTSYELDRQKLLLPINYSDSQLLVNTNAASDAGYIQNFIQACDSITSIDNIPINQLTGNPSSNGPKKITFVNTLDNTYDFPVTAPLKNGQTLQLWSVQASSLTLDISRCNNTDRLSTILAAQASCSACITILPIVETGQNNLLPQVRLSLSEIKSNSGEYLSIAIVTIIVFAEIIMGFLLFVLQSSRLITIVFSLCFDAVGLGIVLHYSVNYHISVLERDLGVFTFQLIPILFFHFILLFPDGKQLSKRAKLILTYCYLITLLVLIFELYANTFPDAQGKKIFWGVITQRIRYIEFILIFLVGLIVLIVKYFKSKLQERLRIGLAIFSLVFSSIFPFLAFTLNSTFGLFEKQSGSETQTIIFLGPTFLIPLVFVYAVLKNRLLGVGIGVRRFVVYSVLTALITVIYFTTSIVFSAMLPFWKQVSKEPIFNVLFLVILTALLQQLRQKIQKIIDRAFSVDPLDYSALTLAWNNELAKTVELEMTFQKVTQQLPMDYHYKNTALLISQPQIIHFFIEGNSSAVYPVDNKAKIPNLVVTSINQQLTINHESHGSNNHRTTDWINNQDLAPVELPRNLTSFNRRFACFALDLSSSYWEYVRSYDWILKQDVALPPAVQTDFSKLSALDIEVAIPLKLGDEFYGALLLGEKVSEYFPPPLDELEHLGNIAIQIAASLHNSLLLAETRALAEKERNQRLTSEAVARRTQEIRQKALSEVAEALHGGPLQALFFLQKNLNRVVTDVTNGFPVDTDLLRLDAKNVGEVIAELRSVTGELLLFGVENDFEGGIRRLKTHFQEKHRELNFAFNFDDKDKLADSLLTEQVKVAMFRVIQEAINNSLKHSQAHNIEITIELSRTTEQTFLLEMRVADDGVGVDAVKLNEFNKPQLQDIRQLEQGKHFGINIIKQQIEQFQSKYQAEINFYSAPGAGFETVVALHINPIISNLAEVGVTNIEFLLSALHTSP